jgi:hypothetical protein
VDVGPIDPGKAMWLSGQLSPEGDEDAALAALGPALFRSIEHARRNPQAAALIHFRSRNRASLAFALPFFGGSLPREGPGPLPSPDAALVVRWEGDFYQVEPCSMFLVPSGMSFFLVY